jgi:hypothetical protein
MQLRLDTASLDRLFDELEERSELAARPAAQAAAQVYYDGMRSNVAAIGRVTGNLESAIYQAYSVERSGPGKATYHISWNARRAPHGGLVEFGHIQRYVAYVGSDGNWYTAVRQEMRGKPRPKGRASVAAKDAYYVPLPSPKQVAAQPFARKAFDRTPQALQAATDALLRTLV